MLSSDSILSAFRDQYTDDGICRGFQGDDDLDVLLAQFKLQDKQHALVKVEEDVPTPSPRCFASFTSVLIQVCSACLTCLTSSRGLQNLIHLISVDVCAERGAHRVVWWGVL